MRYVPMILTEDVCKKHEIMVRFVIPKDREAVENFLPIQKQIFDLVLSVSGMVMVSRIRGWTFYLIYPKICDLLVFDILVANRFCSVV